jgi:protein arginine kinase
MEVQGPEPDVVVSCRVRLARNLRGYPFVTRLEEGPALRLCADLRSALGEARLDGQEPLWVDLPRTPAWVRLLLRERHLISRDMAGVEDGRKPLPGRAVLISQGETSAAMINEEDHLRLQGFAAGFDPGLAMQRVRELEAHLESRVEFACTAELGYLTACPTNVGTGLRASVMLHLPALGLVRSELEKVFTAAARTGLAVRGMYGEGSRAAGDFYQISNQVTLGRAEDELLGDLMALVPAIVDFERRVRAALLEEQRSALEDRVGRSLGMLCNARLLPSEVALQHLSNLRLGAALGLLAGHGLAELNGLTIRIQKGHVQGLGQEVGAEARAESELLDAQQRDRLRALYLRRHFAGGAGSAPGEAPSV